MKIKMAILHTHKIAPHLLELFESVRGPHFDSHCTVLVLYCSLCSFNHYEHASSKISLPCQNQIPLCVRIQFVEL